MTNVNERIAKALGWETEWHNAQLLLHDMNDDIVFCPDYENSIDACMEVILEKWPVCDVNLYSDPKDGYGAGISTSTGISAYNAAETLGCALAEVLAEALEAESE